jgi:hypothetical protein
VLLRVARSCGSAFGNRRTSAEDGAGQGREAPTQEGSLDARQRCRKISAGTRFMFTNLLTRVSQDLGPYPLHSSLRLSIFRERLGASRVRSLRSPLPRQFGRALDPPVALPPERAIAGATRSNVARNEENAEDYGGTINAQVSRTMRLRSLVIHSYRQFVDQRLELLSDVTVLVGRNDAGKTGLFRLIDQHFFERTVHGADQSRVHDNGRPPISFDTFWDVSLDDYRDFAIRAAFGRDDVRTIETRFRQSDAPSWQYIVNGQPFPGAYTTEDGRTFLRPEMNHHGLFPDPHYLNVGDQTGIHPARLLVPSEFEAQFDLDGGYIPLLREHLHITPEQMLLRLAGFRALTRRVTGPGIDAPWEGGRRSRSPVAAADVQRGLNQVAERITQALRQWWKDPDGLTCRIRISDNPHCHEINSFRGCPTDC